MPEDPRFLDFFAGSGLVTEAVREACRVVWANDICPRKAAIYRRNHGATALRVDAIEKVSGRQLPTAEIGWASFPCQDLSLAGNLQGLRGDRSGLFWEWLRVIGEMSHPPAVLGLENVAGLLSSNKSEDYRTIHRALGELGYRVGPMLIDAARWLPQSRLRLFVVAIQREVATNGFETLAPDWTHSESLKKATRGLREVVWWALPRPTRSPVKLNDLIDWSADLYPKTKGEALLELIPARHRSFLAAAARQDKAVFPAYRRTRSGKQVLEVRFDGIAGCLRTARGGSSRQFLLFRLKGEWRIRLLTEREAARLMGAPESYVLGDTYNQSYNAMGDGVAVPVVRHLANHLLAPLSGRPYERTYAAGPGTFCIGE